MLSSSLPRKHELELTPLLKMFQFKLTDYNINIYMSTCPCIQTSKPDNIYLFWSSRFWYFKFEDLSKGKHSRSSPVANQTSHYNIMTSHNNKPFPCMSLTISMFSGNDSILSFSFKEAIAAEFKKEIWRHLRWKIAGKFPVTRSISSSIGFSILLKLSSILYSFDRCLIKSLMLEDHPLPTNRDPYQDMN